MSNKLPTQKISRAEVYNAVAENPLIQRNIAWLQLINQAGLGETVAVELKEPVTEYPYLGTGRCVNKQNIQVLADQFPDDPNRGQVEVLLDINEDNNNKQPHGYIEFK